MSRIHAAILVVTGCARGVMLRSSRGGSEWNEVETGDRGLLLGRRCLYPSE